MTTSSPESEPHVEHTILANGIRQGHTGGLVLSQLHIGLAVGFAIVACLTAFGGGIIVGMWYKASEQNTLCQYLSDFDTGRVAGPESGDREPAARTTRTGDLLQYAHEQQSGLCTADTAGDQWPLREYQGGGSTQPLLPGRQVARRRPRLDQRQHAGRPTVAQRAVQKLRRPRKPRRRQQARHGLQR